MKKILITGANSYVGMSFENWLKQWKDNYIIDTVDMIDGTWKEKDFSGYDVIFHVAGIAHVDTSKATNETQELYYRVNRDLTIETAAKAKKDGVKQFVFMSSIIVYGDSSSIDEKRIITKDTIPNPSNFYGDSKLQAENGIIPMQSENFQVVVLRPPMIYGKGSKGNYPKLAKLARLLPIFPDIENERSMLHIDNLIECIRILIDNNEKGYFFPQNREYVKTSDLVKVISMNKGKKILLTQIFNPIIKAMGKKSALINKIFGNLTYDKNMSEYPVDYCIRNYKETIDIS